MKVALSFGGVYFKESNPSGFYRFRLKSGQILEIDFLCLDFFQRRMLAENFDQIYDFCSVIRKICVVNDHLA